MVLGWAHRVGDDRGKKPAVLSLLISLLISMVLVVATFASLDEITV